VLDESQRPVHQVRVLVEADPKHGLLVLDANVPKFDEFGSLAGGILTPQIRGEGGPLPAVRLECLIELAKENPEGWRLYRLSGPKIRTPLRLATRGDLGDSGPARLLVLGSDKQVEAVIDLTRYGLVVP
jgi:hypothetical protein